MILAWILKVCFFCLVDLALLLFFLEFFWFFPLTDNDLNLNWYGHLYSIKMFSFSLNDFYTASNYLYLSLTDFLINISTLDSRGNKMTIFPELFFCTRISSNCTEQICWMNMISQSCKITSTSFLILLQLSKQDEEKVSLIVCITYFVLCLGKLRCGDCGAPDNWSLSVQTLSVTEYSMSHSKLGNFLYPGSQYSFSGSPLYQLPTCELIPCSQCLSHLEV